MSTTYHFHPESSRGTADYGWLQAKYSFSFGQFYDVSREQFGKLRVLNDDIVQPGEGFGTHPHRNMEIITIPLSGELAHKDSMGHEEVIKTGEVQVMSAGSGIKHSEYNASKKSLVNILQLWVFPNKANVTPRYAQKAFDFSIKNEWVAIVKPFETEEEALWVHQEAYLSIATLESAERISYQLQKENHLVYVFIIDGAVTIGEYQLSKMDALGIKTNEEIIIISSSKESRVLLVEVPK